MIPELLKYYPEGSDITLYNTYYSYAIYKEGRRFAEDFLILVFKDNVTGEKKDLMIRHPNYTYYKLKDNEVHVSYPRFFIEKDKVQPITVPYVDLLKSIAKETGQMDIYETNVANRNRAENKKLHTHPDLFWSDSTIENHYRFKFANTYTNNITKLNKGYFDIEVDGKYAANEFPELGEAPINAVSYLDERNSKVFTFLLRNSDNPLIANFEDEFASGKFNYNTVREFINNHVGEQKCHKYGLDTLTFEIRFYDFELDLLTDLFRVIHRCSPDFVLGWNSSAFDIAYIIERIGALGADAADVMCDQNWKCKIVANVVDVKNLNELAERGDYTFISGYPVFIDQMIQYASRRKAKIGSYKSFKLDDIGELETGVKKLDYHHITKNISNLPWVDYKTFVLYNIMDVIVQKCIETKTNDIEYIFTKCLMSNTVYQKGHRQTVYLVNSIANSMYNNGYVIGNNHNLWNEKPPKYKGAIVGDPTHVSDYAAMKIGDNSIMLFPNCIDYDFTSLYPNDTLESGIAPNTVLGHIDIPKQVYANENVYGEEESKYSRSGEFCENYLADQPIEFCKRWFGLAGIMDMIKDIDEFTLKENVNRVSLREFASQDGTIFIGVEPLTSPIDFVYKPYSNSIYFVDKNHPEQGGY